MCDIEKKSLQEFTELEKKVNDLMLMKKVSPEDLDKLSKEEIKHVREIFSEKLTNLRGTERDNFIEKILSTCTEGTKNQIWEYNHNTITLAISTLIQELGRMPTKMDLTEKTGLSRQTIHKHLKEYSAHPLYQSHQEQFRFMADKVLARIFDFAINGDIKAARLFFDVMGKNMGMTQNNIVQNNYVQINNIKLSQDKIKQLSPEKLSEIESIIKDVIPEKDSG